MPGDNMFPRVPLAFSESLTSTHISAIYVCGASKIFNFKGILKPRCSQGCLFTPPHLKAAGEVRIHFLPSPTAWQEAALGTGFPLELTGAELALRPPCTVLGLPSLPHTLLPPPVNSARALFTKGVCCWTAELPCQGPSRSPTPRCCWPEVCQAPPLSCSLFPACAASVGTLWPAPAHGGGCLLTTLALPPPTRSSKGVRMTLAFPWG